METFFNIRYEFDRAAVQQRIADAVRSHEPGYVCVADGNILAMVHRDAEYRRVVDGALFSVCDSSWVPLYLRRLYGIRREPYCGAQLFNDLVQNRDTGEGYRMAFLGGSESVLADLKHKLAAQNPAIAAMPFIPLPFCAAEEFDYPAIAARLAPHAPDVIWVALGAPKQEQFAARLAAHLTHGIIIGVGAVFNFVTGHIPRAPRWMIRLHLEFLHRLLTEPRKQLHRCLHILHTLPSIYRTERHRARSLSSLPL